MGRVEQDIISKKKRRNCSLGHFPLGGTTGGLMQIASLVIRKFQADLKFHSWKRLQLQLG